MVHFFLFGLTVIIIPFIFFLIIEMKLKEMKIKNNITLRSPTCMEDCHFLNSCHICFDKHISAPQSSSTLLHRRCFVELIFGGGWCILGETALENSLQSNKLVDRKQEVKSTNHLPTSSIVSNKKALLVTSTQPKIFPSLLIPPLPTSSVTGPAWFSTVIPLTTL